MSTALYRRYRPETFAEVIGQDHVTAPLTAALTKDRINHAYLFSGPRGCGKTTSARILARCLNCAEGPTATPCGVCDSCRDLARGGAGSLDVVEIDAASHGGVDDARSLRERAAFAPARDRFKVFIIDEAHMVSTQGFNALLKIVEEPPPHVRFVFATTEPEKVIGTIRSRTHHYPFRLVPPERLQSYLAQLCDQEAVQVGPGVLPLVVRAGAGSVRDSLSVLDQLIAGAAEEGLTYSLAVALLGYTDAALLDDVMDGLAAGDGAAVFHVVDRVIESGHDPRRFVEDLLERLRDLLVVAAVPDGAHAVLRSLAADQLERMRGQAARFGRAELSRAADVVNAALTEMTGATSPRLQLELLCARLLLPGSDDTERGLRARVDRIEKRMGVAGAPAPSLPGTGPVRAEAGWGEAGPARTGAEQTRLDPQPRRPEPESVPAAPAVTAGPAVHAVPAVPPVPTSTPAAAAPTGDGGGMTTEGVRRMWPEVLVALSGLKRATWSLVSQHGQVLDYDGTRLLVGFGSAGLASTFGRGAHQEFLRQALIEVIGLDCRVEPVAGDKAPDRAPPPQPEPVGHQESSAAQSGAVESGAVESVAPRAPVAPASVAPPAAPVEPAGWGVRDSPSAPAAGPPRSEPDRAGRAGPRRARATTSSNPYDGVPPPNEPLPDDEPPLPDHIPPDESPGSAAGQGPATVQGSAAGQGPADDPGTATPRQRITRRAPADEAPRVSAAQDDEVSVDDPDIEGSHLVGPSVVAQLLGGRVIEEREGVTALDLVDGWEVPHVAAAVVQADRVLERRGPTDLAFRLASVSKLLTAYAVMIGVEEEAVHLDDPVGPPGSTLRHLLAHTSGLGFEAADPVRVAPGERRLYSNHGIECAADHLASASGIAFGDYLHEAVLAPLAMAATRLAGSPAHQIVSTVDDLARFVAEIAAPSLLSPETVAQMIAVQFSGVAGFIPGVGRFDPCDWGLGFERNFGRPGHWAGSRLAAGTFGHFGGAGTFLWVDPVAQVGCVCLTDRDFDAWAMQAWPVLGDRVIEAYGAADRAPGPPVTGTT